MKDNTGEYRELQPDEKSKEDEVVVIATEKQMKKISKAVKEHRRMKNKAARKARRNNR